MTDSNEEKKPHKGIYLLPNLFTTAALFAGFYGIVAAMQGRFEVAAVAVFIAMILDGIDGRVARLTHTESTFGAEYDSLSDMASFGLAPALIVYQWSLVHMVSLGTTWGKMGWLAAFIYVAAAALRLARFNAKHDEQDNRYFQGLPSPAAAATLAGMVWVADDLSIPGEQLIFPAFALTLLVAGLMVSNVLYYSFKDIDDKKKVPIMMVFVIALIFAFASIDPPTVIFTGFLLYALSGPFMCLSRLLKKPAYGKNAENNGSS